MGQIGSGVRVSAIFKISLATLHGRLHPGRGIFSRSVGNILARPFDTYYRGLEADTATYRSDAVLYVSECLIVNI